MVCSKFQWKSWGINVTDQKTQTYHETHVHTLRLVKKFLRHSRSRTKAHKQKVTGLIHKSEVYVLSLSKTCSLFIGFTELKIQLDVWMPEYVNIPCKCTVRMRGCNGRFAYSYLHFPAVWAPCQRPVCELCPLELRGERCVTFSLSYKKQHASLCWWQKVPVFTITAIITKSHSNIKLPVIFLLLCSLPVDSEIIILFIFIKKETSIASNIAHHKNIHRVRIFFLKHTSSV